MPAAWTDEHRAPLVQVRELSVAVSAREAETLLVDRVSFEVREGETVGLVGESGCGKTMTALALLRLLPPGVRAVGGEVRLADRDLLRISDREYDALRGSTLAYVSQATRLCRS